VTEAAAVPVDCAEEGALDAEFWVVAQPYNMAIMPKIINRIIKLLLSSMQANSRNYKKRSICQG
jgi:hypothetical protein